MKKVALVFAMLVNLPLSEVEAESLNNDSIVTLVRAGLGEDAVVAKIRSSDGQYDTSVEGLVRLKKAKVPNQIITAMIERSSKKSEESKPVWMNEARDPMLPHTPGLYILTDRSESAKMIPVKATTSRQTKSGGFWSYALTGGIASMSFKAIVPRAHAQIQSGEVKPIFYFFFDQAVGPEPSAFSASATITTPTEFALVRFDEKKDHREKKVGKFNITGPKSGLAEKDKIPFTYSEIRSGVFEVIPVNDLPPGEYGFVTDNAGSGGNVVSGIGGVNRTVFDFSIVTQSDHLTN